MRSIQSGRAKPSPSSALEIAVCVRASAWPSSKLSMASVFLFLAPLGFPTFPLEKVDRFRASKSYKNTFTGIRIEFIGLSQLERLRVQSILQRLKLYRNKVDGKWGKDTFSGILAYNTLFNRKIGITDQYNAQRVLRQILSHTRFVYNNGPIKEKTKTVSIAGSVSKKSANSCN